ncbi:hypothetical protein ACHAWF_013536 [Thalassiosira exigua]
MGSTKFADFWMACKEVMLPEARAEERRHSDTMYASRAHSIPNLVKLAKDALQRRVDGGKLKEMPPIPSLEWVRLQFVPNCAHSAAAARFTGLLEMKRAVQSRTLRKEHIDQHWVHAFTGYYLEWLIELKLAYNGVEFFGQDDKSKIPIGDKASVPVSTGVRSNNKGIVSTGDNVGLKALDHDFHVGNGIPSVTLRCNIPKDITGSFFIGDEQGHGQIFVTMRDAIFDPSEIFDHCAQLIDAIRSKGLSPTVLVLQTDGGPDHSLKRVAVKLALTALFKELNLDRLVVLRCAPNGSASDIVERSMSVLNLPLAHVSLCRSDMPAWAEKAVKNRSTMKSIRDAAEKVDTERHQATNAIPTLKLELKFAIMCEWMFKRVEFEVESDAAMTKSVSRALDLIGSFVEIKGGTGTDISGAMVTRVGISITRDNSLQASIWQSRLDKAVEFASRNLRDEWKNSVAAPLNEVATRFSHLTTGGRPVIVRPHVQREKVQALYNQLKKIDGAYSPESVSRKEDLGQVPRIVNMMGTHAIVTPYSFDLAKVRGCACCGDMLTPIEHQELAFQRQPTPIEDPNRKGHYYRRGDALERFSGKLTSLTDLSHLPSHMEEMMNKDLAKRDVNLAKELKLKSWDSKRIRALVVCYNCGKRRCIYSPTDESYTAAITALHQKLESVSGRYSCGDLLFDDGHPLSRVIVQKQNLTCESQIEKGYYGNKERSLKLKPICIHCGEKGSKDFLLCQDELEMRCLTGGYKCFPICVGCIDAGKRVVNIGRKNELKAREERARLKSKKGK